MMALALKLIGQNENVSKGFPTDDIHMKYVIKYALSYM